MKNGLAAVTSGELATCCPMFRFLFFLLVLARRAAHALVLDRLRADDPVVLPEAVDWLKRQAAVPSGLPA